MAFDVGNKGFSAKGGFSAGKGSFKKAGGVDDPLEDVEYSDSLEDDASEELAALKKGFEDRAKAERKRFKQAVDSEFWFAVCFKSREEKEEFLQKIGVKKKLMGDKYIDGHKLGQVLGV